MKVALDIKFINSEDEEIKAMDLECAIDRKLNYSDEMCLWLECNDFYDIYIDELTESEIKIVKKFMNLVKFYGDLDIEEIIKNRMEKEKK